MPIVIGLAPDERGEAAARLGAMLARASGEELVVASVTPSPWPPNPKVDEEYRAVREDAARQAMDRARAILDDLSCEYVIGAARSVASGLVQVAQEHSASMIVLGSTARGLIGRVSLGSVAERILHTLDVPVAFAPAGFGTSDVQRATRVTVGFGRGDHDSGLLAAAAERADRLGLRLRVACFAVRPPSARGTSIEESAETLVIAEWVEQVRADIDAALRAADVDPLRVEIVVGAGTSWEEAIGAVSWSPGDVLAIGASVSAVRRFLLGSHAAKIARNSPVPVFIVARH